MKREMVAWAPLGASGVALPDALCGGSVEKCEGFAAAGSGSVRAAAGS